MSEGATARTAAVAVAATGLASAVAWLNRNQEQYIGLSRRYEALARVLAGEDATASVTYPAWGYPWLLRMLPLPELSSVVLQVAVAVGVLLLVRRELHRLGVSGAGVDAFCVGAFPWFALASLRLADPWAASLVAAGLVALAASIRRRALRLALLSGLCFGAAANVRSEVLVLVPAAALASFAAAPASLRRDALHWAVAVALTLLLLLPWGWFRTRHGAPFGLTTTNSGMVLYNSLGFQGNAWGIVASDGLRRAEAHAHFGAPVDPASPEASRWFRERALAAIRERPAEYVRKVGHNFAAILKFGFHGIEMEPLLEGEDRARFEVAKEQLKRLAGAKVNPLDVERMRREGRWDDDFSLRSVPPRLWLVLALPLANAALSAGYLVALLASLAWMATFGRCWLADAFVRATIGFTVATWTLLCLLQYEPRQANPLFLFGMPIVAIAGRAALVRRRRAAETTS